MIAFRIRHHEPADTLALLAEFGPASWCARAGDTFRAGDGLGCVGTGPSWEHAAANLRAAKLERATLLARLDRQHRERRERLARNLARIAWGLFALLALAAAVLESRG